MIIPSISTALRSQDFVFPTNLNIEKLAKTKRQNQHKNVTAFIIKKVQDCQLKKSPSTSEDLFTIDSYSRSS